MFNSQLASLNLGGYLSVLVPLLQLLSQLSPELSCNLVSLLICK